MPQPNNSTPGENETAPPACRRYDTLQDLPGTYDDLFSRGEQLSFDLGRDWFELLAATALERDDRALLYALETHGPATPLAVLPLRRQSDARRLVSLSTYYSSLFLPLLSEAQAAQHLTTLLRCMRAAPERWTELRLYPMPADQPLFETVIAALQTAGWRPFRYFCFGNWYLPLEGCSFGAYWQGLSSRLRNTVERKRKKFFARPGARLEIVTGGDGLEAAIAAYDTVYRASWKSPEPYPDFIPGLIRLCAAKGALRLGLAYIDNEPAAAQLWLVSHDRAAIYKLAYDERFTEYSVGSILTAHLLRHVIDVDRVKEVDYLSGDDSYKRQWMSRRRERWGVVAFNPATISGFIGMCREQGRRLAKAVLGRAERHRA